MPGDFAAVLLSTSPPLFGTSPRLAFVVPDVTKSYLARLTAQCADRSTSGAASTAAHGVNGVQAALNGRTCFSDTDMQKALPGSSSAIQQCASRSEPLLCGHSNGCSQQSALANGSKTPEGDDSDEYVSIHVRSDDRRPSVDSGDGNESSTRTSGENAQEDSFRSVSSDQLAALALLLDAGSHSDNVAQASSADSILRDRSGSEDLNCPETQSQADSAHETHVEGDAETAPERKPNKKGHRLRFADEVGKALRMERVIEDEDELAPEQPFDRGEQDGSSDSCSAFSSPLVLEFAQPVSDYLQFREKLDRLNVSLENVLAIGYRVSGTVRVRNLAFHKSVFVRYSTDHWWSHTDQNATFVDSDSHPCSSSSSSSSAASNTNTMYDSFAFDLGDLSNKLTLHSANSSAWSAEQQRIELAVCFVCGSESFWDNNAGRNYSIVYVPPQDRGITNNSSDRRRKSPYTNTYRPDFSAFQGTFSEFTAWTHYDSFNPYY